jgi:hypothetical protein
MTIIILGYWMFGLSIAYYIYGPSDSIKGLLGGTIIVPGIALTLYFLSVLSVLYVFR